jgi:multidrug efflux pump subunit AcrA (membrane-fusion protein)
MKFHSMLMGGALCLAVAAGSAMAQDSGHVDANGMPTDHSTPAEQAQTQSLNNSISSANQASDAAAAQNNAQYQQQQQQYQGQLQQNQAAQAQYQNQSANYADQNAAYQSLKARYAAERAAYHREVFPDRYVSWRIASDENLVGQRVEIINGDRVGTVTDVARSPGGQIEALRVSLDSDKVVWIDQADVRFDRAGGTVMTDLDRNDLRQMADERL